MTEQTYKEATAAIKESGIALDLQKEILSSIERDFNTQNKWILCSERLQQWEKSSTDIVIKSDVLAWQQLPEPYKSCTGATKEEGYHENQK